MSPITCLKKITLKKIYIFQKKVGQSGGASQWMVCYQLGLPRLDMFSFCSTELQVVLAMARNLSIGSIRKIYPKSAKKCLNVSKRGNFGSSIRTRLEG